MVKAFMIVKRFQFYLWAGAVWLLIWIINSLMNYPETFVPHALNEIWRAFYIAVANFMFFEYSLPLIRKKRSTILFNILIGFLLVVLHIVILSFGLYGWKYLGIQLHIYTSLRQVTLVPGGTYYLIMEEVSYQAQGGVTSFFFFGFATLIYDNVKLKQAAKQLRIAKQEAELNYLKSQTNPHFLFNTLNNIYTLASDKSDLAPESILRLSKILRFMLYKTGREFINVAEELEIIKDYIALEKLRYDDSLHINFKYDIDDMRQPLPPLLLIPLVENAFKHGISQTMEQPFIEIHLSVNQQQLLFIVKNSTVNLHEQKNQPDGRAGVKENIGLSNLRRQLQLLYTMYDLAVLKYKSEFTVTLKINLSSHA